MKKFLKLTLFISIILVSIKINSCKMKDDDITPKCKAFDCNCLDSNIFTKVKGDCPNKLANECYLQSYCKIQKESGQCGFTYTKGLKACLNLAQNCIVGGSFNQICTLNKGIPIFPFSKFKNEYVCYKKAKCEVQDNGNCAWTQTLGLINCLQEKRETELSKGN